MDYAIEFVNAVLIPQCGLAAAAGDAAQDIRPPYYALAFIMRVV